METLGLNNRVLKTLSQSSAKAADRAIIVPLPHKNLTDIWNDP